MAEKAKRVRAPRAARAAAKARETPMPEGWAPTPDHFTKGLELGLDEASVRIEADLFASRTARDGKTYIDWNAAFRNHLVMEKKFALQRKAAAEAKAAAQEAARAPPTSGATDAELIEGYGAGIIAAVGGTFVCDPRHVRSLRSMLAGHARTPSGEAIPPQEEAAWMRRTAEAYRHAVAADEARFQANYAPPACMNWLNGGRKIIEPRGSPGARLFKSRGEESRERHNQRGHLDADAAQIGTPAPVPNNRRDMKV